MILVYYYRILLIDLLIVFNDYSEAGLRMVDLRHHWCSSSHFTSCNRSMCASTEKQGRYILRYG